MLLLQFVEGQAIHELGDDVAALGVGSGVIEDLQHIFVVEMLDCPCFARKPDAVPLRPTEVGVQHLDRDVPTEREVTATVHRRHAPFTDLLQDLVLIEHAPDQLTAPGVTFNLLCHKDDESDTKRPYHIHNCPTSPSSRTSPRSLMILRIVAAVSSTAFRVTSMTGQDRC